jgi:hypothetical protein
VAKAKILKNIEEVMLARNPARVEKVFSKLRRVPKKLSAAPWRMTILAFVPRMMEKWVSPVPSGA